MSVKRTSKNTARGPIEPGVCYPMQDFRRRVGFGDIAWRDARRNGLRVFYVHRRPFVIGDDFIAYLREHGSDDPLCREADGAGNGSGMP